MAARRDHIVRLTSTPREMEAGILVAILEENGIQATMTGEATAGFRAEAPGWVQVLVAEDDLLHAQAVLRDLRGRREEIDWSQVDVGEPEETHLPDAVPWPSRHWLWRRVAYVVVIVMLAWFVIGFAAEVVGLILRTVGVGP